MDKNGSIHAPQVLTATLPESTTSSNSNIIYKNNPKNILNDPSGQNNSQTSLSTLVKSFSKLMGKLNDHKN